MALGQRESIFALLNGLDRLRIRKILDIIMLNSDRLRAALKNLFDADSTLKLFSYVKLCPCYLCLI